MLKRASYLEIAEAVFKQLRENTSFPWYDSVPLNTPAPLGIVEIVGKTDNSTKTHFKETFELNVHVIARKSDARTEMYKMMHEVTEAMTVPLELDCCLLQIDNGIQSTQKDETGEWHGIISYHIMVAYPCEVK